MLSGLQILDLKDLGTDIPPGAQLLAILASSPGLVELKLRGTYRRQYSPALPQTTLVDLPMLETLIMTSIPRQLTHDLLAAIHIPRCTSFEVDYEQDYDSDLGLFNNPVLTHIASLLVTHIRSSPLVTIAWADKGAPIDLLTSNGAVAITFLRSEGVWCDTVPPGVYFGDTISRWAKECE
ncbi:hypothetical protein FRB94_002265 [Tulasnella sp. JGI-2019a]|nr:hypothetical protein FRB93_004075 [Tulasnella sp. JGI-2019a]KAG9004589.1 hypothetical protein FRB94_002265 [Tulasnella sp. JGI-2019a]KAG9031147.1 hypothetical protein FRB95_003121 [Tulasnella sp. JGI-2019a]